MLRISKTDGMIGINTTNAKMSISQPKPDFEIHQKESKLIIQTDPIRIKIDQSQCRNEIGLKNNTAFMQDVADMGMQAASAAIDRIVSEGNAMAAFENGSAAIAEIAANNTMQLFERNINFLPRSKPQIDFVGGNVDISVDEGYVDIKSKPNKPIIDVIAGSVEIYLIKQPEFKFEFVGNDLDVSV